MPFHRFSALLLALVLCLLPGCGERPISSRLVLSSMGVECSARPLTAVLEVIREEENETITVQGESFTALFSAAERQTGEQVYLGALQSIVFSGVPDGSTLREYLRALLADGRLSPNTQIALCGDALSLYDGEALTGDSITALLTRQYTDSRRNGLKELLNLLEGTGRDGLIPWLTNANGLADSRLNTDRSEGNAFNGTGFFDILFLKDFKFTFNVGVSLDETRRTTVQNPYFGQFADENGIIGKYHTRDFSHNLQQILNYTKVIGKHNVNVMLGHEYYQRRQYLLYGSTANMFSPDNDELAGAVIDKQSATSYVITYNNEGYFGRAQYDYDGKYFFSASYRRDASSRFHPSHRWGNFWSVGAAWIVTKENFMSGTHGWLDMLKVKASIGSQGNDKIGDYRYVDTYRLASSNGEMSVAFLEKGNPNITWETNTNFNAGIEFGVLQNRISGSIEYFNRKTTDMLMAFPTAPSLGYSSYYANVGDMSNKGIEVDLNFTPIRSKNVQWDINVNLTHLKNKIISLPPERRTKEVEGYYGYAGSSFFYGQGLPLYTFYMKKYAGVSEDGRSMWYKDVTDKDGKPTGERTTTTAYSEGSDYLCGNAIPDLYGGFGTSVSFFGFDFGINFNYQIGGKIYDSGYAAAMSTPTSTGSIGVNWHKDILNAWTPENPNSNIPRMQYGDSNTTDTSDRFLIDASYLTLQNINFGYTLPSKFTQKFGVGKMRIYLACENVFYWSKRKGLDPRYADNTDNQGVLGTSNYATYSPIRTISGGINIQF